MPLMVFLPVMAAGVAAAGGVGMVAGQAAPGKHCTGCRIGLLGALTLTAEAHA